jgi:hypothetical protein
MKDIPNSEANFARRLYVNKNTALCYENKYSERVFKLIYENDLYLSQNLKPVFSFPSYMIN